MTNACNSDHSHKGMGGEVIAPEDWDLLLAERDLTFVGDAQNEGGLLRRPTDGLAVAWVKPPLFRQESNTLRGKDILPLITSGRPDAEHVGVHALKAGTELELYAYNVRTKDIEPIMSDEGQRQLEELVPIHSKDLFGATDTSRWSCSAELAASCIEVNFPESADRARSAFDMVQRLRLLDRVVEKLTPGTYILPVSTLPHRELTQDDLTSNPYVRRMALDVMGWEKVRNFTCASVQGHTEGLSMESILGAANELQHLSPLLYGLTLAAPFTHGEPSGLSGRYKTRMQGSPSAGIYDTPLPTTMGGYYDLVEGQLKAGTTPSAARGAGQHKDRTRFDIAPYGTIESCEGDTAGASPAKLVAIQYLKDVLLWKLQRQHIVGDTSHYEQYPRLFRPPSKQSYELSHDASYKIAAEGLDAFVFGQDDTEYAAKDLVVDMLRYADEPVADDDGTKLFSGLPTGVKQEIWRSSRTPTSEAFSYYRRGGAVDISGYYEIGIGTLAHWQSARYADLRAGGMAHEAAIHNMLVNTAESWRHTIRILRPESVSAIVRCANRQD